MRLASTTLLCLNGLKSSLMCTGPFLGGLVPKNGFGGPCGDASAPFTFGDAVDDEVPFGFGDPPYGVSQLRSTAHMRRCYLQTERQTSQ